MKEINVRSMHGNKDTKQRSDKSKNLIFVVKFFKEQMFLMTSTWFPKKK